MLLLNIFRTQRTESEGPGHTVPLLTLNNLTIKTEIFVYSTKAGRSYHDFAEKISSARFEDT